MFDRIISTMRLAALSWVGSALAGALAMAAIGKDIWQYADTALLWFTSQMRMESAGLVLVTVFIVAVFMPGTERLLAKVAKWFASTSFGILGAAWGAGVVVGYATGEWALLTSASVVVVGLAVVTLAALPLLADTRYLLGDAVHP